jgi:hypothetical protein
MAQVDGLRVHQAIQGTMRNEFARLRCFERCFWPVFATYGVTLFRRHVSGAPGVEPMRRRTIGDIRSTPR